MLSALRAWIQRLRGTSSDPAMLERGHALYRAGDHAEAAAEFERVARANPRSFLAFHELGRTRLKLHDPTSAKVAFRRALELDPRAAATWFELGVTLRRSGRLNAAREALERVSSLDPGHVAATLELGRVLVADRRHAEALTRLEPLCEVGDIGVRTSARLLIGQALRHLGRLEDAELVLSRALDEDAASPELELELGELTEAAGDSNAAASHYELAVQLAPDHAETHHRLARIHRTAGRYTAALAEARIATRLAPSQSGFAELLRVIEGDRRVLDEGVELRLAQRETGWNQPDCITRVLHVLETSLPHRKSGYAVRSHYLLRAQAALGLEPEACTRPGFPASLGVDGYEPCDVIDAIPYRRLPHEGNPNYNRNPLDEYLDRYAAALQAAVLERQPHVLHAASNFKNGIAAHAVARSVGIPFVYEVRGVWEDSLVALKVIAADSERYEWFRDLEIKCAQRADAVVTLSEALAQDLVARGVEASKIFIVPNAVDSQRFYSVERDTELARRLDLGHGPVIGYIGSLVAYEGVDLLVEAFARVVQEIPRARLLIAGDGDHLPTIERRIRDLGLGEATRLLGHVPHDDILAHYSLIDVFVLPRRPLRVCELVTPLKPFEAMATGRAVIASDLAALREAVRDGDTGALFPAGDSDALAAVCIRLCHDESARRSLGTKAAAWIAEHRTWSRVAATYREVYAAAGSRG